MLGVPTLKLRGDYLAIVTISAAEIIRYVGRSSLLTDFTGSAQGIPGSQYRDPFTNLSFFGNGSFTLIPFNYTDVADGAAWVRIIGWVVVVGVHRGARLRAAQRRQARQRRSQRPGRAAGRVRRVPAVLPVPGPQPEHRRQRLVGALRRLVDWCCSARFVVFLLVRSPWGRLLRGIREDEDAIRSLGKNVFAIKMQALIIGGLFGALGGMRLRAAGQRAAGLDGSLADLLLLHRAAARWRRDDLRPGARLGHLLRRPDLHQADRHRPTSPTAS